MIGNFIRRIAAAAAPPSAEVLAQRELENAKRDLLHWQTQAEFSDSQVVYNQARIERLQDMLAAVNAPKGVEHGRT